MRRLGLVLAVFSVLPVYASAEDVPAPTAAAGLPEDPGLGSNAPENPELAKFEASLQYQTGDVALGDDLATIHLGDALRFLGPAEAERVLVAWGNPPGHAVLGMVLPVGISPFHDESWAVLVTYSDEGYVSDEDAKDIDFSELLTEMKADTEAANEERTQAGYPAVHLVGWAEPPRYDATSQKLFWAKELDFAGSEAHSLNYDIRVLGRKGVLELSAIAGIEQLATIKAEMPKVLAAVEFNPGMRYADFVPDVDKVAGYGIGALVAGKIAAKAGLFKVIVGVLLASKKLLAALAVGLFIGLKRIFTGGKKDEETQTTSV